MTDRKPLKSYFPNYITDGALFSKMQYAPWMEIPGAALSSDIAYLASYSGTKPATYLLEELSDDGVLNQQMLADMLWTIFGKQWQKLWNGFNLEYNPLNNYDVHDVTEREMTNDRTINKDIHEVGTVDTTDKLDSETNISQNGTENVTGTVTVQYGKKTDTTGETDTFVYGFNSSDKVPTQVVMDQSHETQGGSDITTTQENTITKNDTKTDVDSKDVVNTATDTTTDDDTTDNQKEKEEIIRDRAGNIGQNTYQELLRQEFELWKWNFWKQVFTDCDYYLVLSLYGC